MVIAHRVLSVCFLGCKRVPDETCVRVVHIFHTFAFQMREERLLWWQFRLIETLERRHVLVRIDSFTFEEFYFGGDARQFVGSQLRWNERLSSVVVRDSLRSTDL